MILLKCVRSTKTVQTNVLAWEEKLDRNETEKTSTAESNIAFQENEGCGFDSAPFDNSPISATLIKTVVRKGPPRHSNTFPGDGKRKFPNSILKSTKKLTQKTGEVSERD